MKSGASEYLGLPAIGRGTHPIPFRKQEIWSLVGNSEVKLRSVSGVSVVFGHVKPGKLAAPSFQFLVRLVEEKSSKFITINV